MAKSTMRHPMGHEFWRVCIHRIGIERPAGVYGFKGSGVQGSILVPGLYLGCVFTRKASDLSFPI